MVRRRASAVSGRCFASPGDHEARGPSFETPLAAPQDEAECVAAKCLLSLWEKVAHSAMGSSTSIFAEQPSSAALRVTFSKGRRKQGRYFPFTIRRQCSHAARIKFSLASGVRKAECADSVTLSSFVSG